MNQDEKKITIARLESMPENMKVSIGKSGAFDKWELIDHVKDGDEVGKLIVDVYMSNIRAFKKEIE